MLLLLSFFHIVNVDTVVVVVVVDFVDFVVFVGVTPTGYHGSVNSSVDASSSDAVIDGKFAVTGVVNVDVAVVIGVTDRYRLLHPRPL